MPKSDTWPGGVAMETLSNMDSAGSCDSVISVNSAFSDDSMEHLSPEERACLMFLEETIESLELEEDSGLSNDELDGGQHGETTPQQPSIPTDIETTPQQQSVPSDIKTTPQQTPVPSDIKTTPQQSSVPNDIETTPQKSSIPSDIETTPQQLSVPNDIETTPQQLSVPSDTETTPSITHDAQGFQHDETGRDQKSFLSGGVPTPFLLANSLPERASTDIAEPETPEEPTEPTSAALSIEHSAQHQAPPHDHADPQTSADADDANAPTTAPTTEQTSPELQTQDADPATDTRTPSPAATSTTSDSDTSVVDRDEGTEKDAQPGGHSSEIDLDLIPPPSDFRDESTTPQPEPEHQTDQELLDSVGTSQRSSITPTDMEDLGRQAVKTPSPVTSPVSLDPPSKPPVEVPVSGHAPSSLPEMPQPSPPLEAVEIKSPPAVAPRPKKLPSNIILKSHKPPGSNGTPAHPVSSSSDRLILDPQRVRMEALRKLGLLKSEERVPGPPVLSPNNLSRGSRRSWAAPSAPLSPPHVPTSRPSPLPVPTINPPPASVPVPSQVPGTVPPPTVEASLADSSAVRDTNILPAPVAFSDTVEHLVPPTDYAGSDAQVPVVPPASPKNKSATLECSGMGLSGYMASQKSESTGGGATNAQRCLSEVRNTRARPASLGSGKDFSEAQGGYQESLPAAHLHPHLAGDLQKLPRSHGISVVICPRAKNGEDRREALKKLGLLRD